MPKPRCLAADRLGERKQDRDQLRQWLADLGWTQEVFADHIGYDRRATVNEWLRGRMPIPKLVMLYVPLFIREMSRARGGSV